MTKYEWKIMGKYRNSSAEEIDTAKNENDAEYLVGEYLMAFGSGWRIWKVRKRV